MSDWKEYRLGDVTDWSSGGTPSKKNDDFWGGDIPWISASSMNGNRYSDSSLKITESGLNAGSRLAAKDTILLLVRGSTLHQRILVGITTCDVAFNQDVKAIMPKEEFLDSWYLLFWFMSIEKDLLNMVENTGIGAGKLDTKLLQNLTIKIPPEEERERIKACAKAIDDKLILNSQTNQTLEQIAQAIFKSWFVDFEPVKAKIQAKQNCQDPERAAMCAISGKSLEELEQLNPETQQQLKTTAALFPDALVESELGEIPEGWCVGSIGDVAKAKGGYAFKGNSFVEEGNPVVKIKNITGDGRVDLTGAVCIDDEQAQGAERFKLNDGDLLMAMTGATVAKIGFVATAGKAVYLNQRVAKFESEKFGSKISWFLYCCFQRQSIFDSVVGAAQGSAQPNISSTGIESTKLVLSSDDLIVAFCEHADSLFKKWLSNINENSMLEENRDILLPKLLSGELEINNVT